MRELQPQQLSMVSGGINQPAYDDEDESFFARIPKLHNDINRSDRSRLEKAILKIGLGYLSVFLITTDIALTLIQDDTYTGNTPTPSKTE